MREVVEMAYLFNQPFISMHWTRNIWSASAQSASTSWSKMRCANAI